MGTEEDEKGMPKLALIDGSEVEACVDIQSIDVDGTRRPVFISQDTDYLNLTVKDARRILDFLNEAIPQLEVEILEH
jgi:hypothetical protein